ncbi:MAG: sulfatase-like hydrolase/transferase [Candidatus Sedimenticola sp. 6PFRAG7]
MRLANSWLISIVTLFLTMFIARITTLLFIGPEHGASNLELLHALLYGWRFDIALAALCSTLLLLANALNARFVSRHPYIAQHYLLPLLPGLLLLLLAGESLYYLEAGRHISYEVKSIFSDAKGLLLQGWHTHALHMILLTIGLIVITYLAYRFNVRISNRLRLNQPTRASLLNTEIPALLLLLVSIFFIRGSKLYDAPLEQESAFELGNMRLVDYATNGAYNVIYSLLSDRNALRIYPLPAIDDELALYLPQFEQPQKITSATPRKRNVILIFLESWASENMQPYRGKSVTPFFDQLSQQSVRAKRMIAGGLRTSEGLFSALCSWQNPLGQSIAQSQLESHHYHCLPQILADAGYYTQFMQGSNKSTSGVGAFAHKLGFRHSTGKHDMPTGVYQHNAWGAHDHDIYSYLLDTITEAPEPYFLALNTNTTHDKHIPTGVSAPFPDDKARLNTLNFADQALASFMQRYKKKFPKKSNNTLFVLVADHTAGLQRQASDLSKFVIPHLIYAQDVLPLELDISVSQRDIAPTILDYLDQPIPRRFWGRSLLDYNGTRSVDFFLNGRLNWVVNDAVLSIDLKDGNSSCWRIEAISALQPESCSPQQQEQHQRALAFTQLSQTKLFDNTIVLPE